MKRKNLFDLNAKLIKMFKRFQKEKIIFYENIEVCMLNRKYLTYNYTLVFNKVVRWGEKLL